MSKMKAISQNHCVHSSTVVELFIPEAGRPGVTQVPWYADRRERDYNQVTKMVNFQDGWLLPRLPDPRQKPSSLKQRPCELFFHQYSPGRRTDSTSSRPDQDMVTQQLWANQSVFLSTGQPQIREGNSRESLKCPSLGLRD